MDDASREYFQTVEEHFIRRRGQPLLLSPGDVQRVAEWHGASIPLSAVLEGIDVHFDRLERRGRAPRRAVTLAYLEDDVMDAWAGTRRRRVGGRSAAPPAATLGGSHEHARLLDALAAAGARLEAGGGPERAMATAVFAAAEKLRKKADLFDVGKPDHDAQRTEDHLRRIERSLTDAAREALGDGVLSIEREVAAQLADRKALMTEATWQRVTGQLLEKSLRDRFGLPRLSLFYQ